MHPESRFPFLYNFFFLLDLITSFSPTCLSGKQSIVFFFFFKKKQVGIVDLPIILSNVQTFQIIYQTSQTSLEGTPSTKFPVLFSLKKKLNLTQVRTWLCFLWEVSEMWFIWYQSRHGLSGSMPPLGNKDVPEMGCTTSEGTAPTAGWEQCPAGVTHRPCREGALPSHLQTLTPCPWQDCIGYDLS